MSRHRRIPLPTMLALAVTTSTDIGAAMVSPRGENVRLAVMPVLPVEGGRTIVDLAAVATLVRAWKPEQAFLQYHPVSYRMKVREAASRQLSVGALRGLLTGLGVDLIEIDPYWVHRSDDPEADRCRAIRTWPHLRDDFTRLSPAAAEAAILADTARDPRGYYA